MTTSCSPISVQHLFGAALSDAAVHVAVRPAEPEVLAVDDAMYSPIQRLVDKHRAGMFGACIDWKSSRNCLAVADADARSCAAEAGAGLDTLTSLHATGTSLAAEFTSSFVSAKRPKYCCDIGVAQSGQCEFIDESLGATGDAWRFRYDEYSPEESYSPIAAVHPIGRVSGFAREHVWSTHVDSDGAVCSQAIVVPLDLVVQAEDGSQLGVQVLDGMYVRHLKEKLWNITGLCPRQQRLVMANGAEAPDEMPFAGSGMKPGDVLLLKVA